LLAPNATVRRSGVLSAALRAELSPVHGGPPAQVERLSVRERLSARGRLWVRLLAPAPLSLPQASSPQAAPPRR